MQLIQARWPFISWSQESHCMLGQQGERPGQPGRSRSNSSKILEELFFLTLKPVVDNSGHSPHCGPRVTLSSALEERRYNWMRRKSLGTGEGHRQVKMKLLKNCGKDVANSNQRISPVN
ncbi:hypothetical protein H920_07150 [Fukomys damarensis]|uniref:Uncharacterized protein n=1 Tax=Fukomys damarensis TaxID=885580 RepID=A0A091DGZ3_FUKDA|nr:hypothetical protein H920_07150 [Fukomys damarensis]